MPSNKTAPRRKVKRISAGDSAPTEKRLTSSLKALGLFLKQTRTFRLALALHNDPVKRDAIIRELATELEADEFEILTLDLREPSHEATLLGRVQEILNKSQTGKHPVVMVVNLEGRVDYTPELSHHSGSDSDFLATANLHRESFAKSCPCPLVLWMNELLERAFMSQAPDLWQWRSHVFDLRTRKTPKSPYLGVSAEPLRSDNDQLHPEHRLQLLEEELAAYRKTGSRLDELRVLNAIGLARLDTGNARLGKKDFEEVLRLAIDLGARRWEGNALGNLGNAHHDLGESRKAIEYFEKQLNIAHEIHDLRGEGNALGGLGLAHADLGDASKAIEFYSSSLVLHRKSGNQRGVAATFGNLGGAYYLLGDPVKAIEYFEQDLAISRELRNRRSEAIVICNLGSAYGALGDFDKANEHFEQALANAREIGDRRLESNALWNSGLALDSLGKRAEAIARAEAAIKIRETITNQSTAKVRLKLDKWLGK
jgi:tetratricopeptide (TPR) repeat protein